MTQIEAAAAAARERTSDRESLCAQKIVLPVELERVKDNVDSRRTYENEARRKRIVTLQYPPSECGSILFPLGVFGSLGRH